MGRRLAKKNEIIARIRPGQPDRNYLKADFSLLARQLDPYAFSERGQLALFRFLDRRIKLHEQVGTANLLQVQARGPAGMLQIAAGLAVEVHDVEPVIDENRRWRIARQ